MCRFLQRYKGHLRNNKGIALVSVLVVSTVLALVGSAYLSTSTHEAGLINQQVSDAQLLYAADAGKEMAKRVLKDSLCGGASLEGSYSNQFTLPGQSDPVLLAMDVSSSGSGYNLTSTAEFKGVQKQIKATLTEGVEEMPLYNYGIYAKEVLYGEEDDDDEGRLVKIYRPFKHRKWKLWFPRRRARVLLKQGCRESGCHNNYYLSGSRYYYSSTGYWKSRKRKSTNLTGTVLTDSHADFIRRRVDLTKPGWQLVPNVKEDDNVYPIVAYDRHTITVSGDMLVDGAETGDRYRIERVFDTDPEIKFYTYDSSDENIPITPVDRETVIKEDDFCFPVLSGNGFNEAAFISKPVLPTPAVQTTLDCSGQTPQDYQDGEDKEVDYFCQIRKAMRKHRGGRTTLRVKSKGSGHRVYVFRGNTKHASKNTLVGKRNKVVIQGNSTLHFPNGGLTLAPHSELEISGNPAIIKIDGHLHLGYKSKLIIKGDAYIDITGHLRVDRRAVLQVNKTAGSNGDLTIISAQSNVGAWVDSDPAIFLRGSKWKSKGGSLITDGDLVVYNPQGDLVVKRRGQLKVGGNATFNLNNFIVKRKGFGHRPRIRALNVHLAEHVNATLMTKCDKHTPHTHFHPKDDDEDDEDKNEDGTTNPNMGKLAKRQQFCKGHHFPANVTKKHSCMDHRACHAGGGGRFAKIWRPRHPGAFTALYPDYLEVDIAGETTLATHGGIYLYYGNLKFGHADADDIGSFTTLASRGNIHIRRSNVLFNGDVDIDAGDGSLGQNGEPEDSFIMITKKYGTVKFAGQAMIEHNGAYIDIGCSKMALGDELQIYGNRVINIGHFGLPKIAKVKKVHSLKKVKHFLKKLAKYRWAKHVDELGDWGVSWKNWRDAKFDYTKYLADKMRLKDTSKLVIINTGNTVDGARTLTRRTFFGLVYSPNAEVEVADLPPALEDRIPSYFWGAIATNETVTLHKRLKFYYDKALADSEKVNIPVVITSGWELVSAH